MPKLPSATLLVAIFVGADLQAQLPPNKIFLSDGDAASGGTNQFPWSRETLRYQTIFPAALFKSQPCLVNDILVAPSTRMDPSIQTAVYEDIEIRMGATALATPTTDWGKNNPNPTTVYRGPMRVTFEKSVWRGMGLPKPYLHTPTSTQGNLCVEFILWKFDAAFTSTTRSIQAVTTSVQRAFYHNWTQSQSTQPTVGSGGAKMGLVCHNGHFVVTEQGCTSSSKTTLAISANTYPKQGKPISISLTGGSPDTPVVLVVGGTDTRSALGTFPIDAGPLGARGCFIWNDWLAFAATSTDRSTGNAILDLTVPARRNAPRAYAHWWNLDPKANALGMTSSNYAKILLGD